VETHVTRGMVTFIAARKESHVSSSYRFATYVATFGVKREETLRVIKIAFVYMHWFSRQRCFTLMA